MSQLPAVGVDIGGTTIAAGLVDADGRIIGQEYADTPAQDDIPATVADLAHRVRGEESVTGIGVGAAGFIDDTRSTVMFAPNIQWRDEPLAHRIEALIDVPVVIENDANAAAWGEFQYGAGHDTDDLVLVTVGTGIGGGIVHRGALIRGGFGCAGEIGHMRVVPDGRLCGCGQYGCWEQYASGQALDRLASSELVGADGPALTQLARNGHAEAINVLAELGQWLGAGIASLCTVLDPRVVAVGGGVAAAGELLLEPAIDAFNTYWPAAAHRPSPVLRLATLGNRAGIVGAADLSRAEPAHQTRGRG